jgi:hypothetical protein
VTIRPKVITGIIRKRVIADPRSERLPLDIGVALSNQGSKERITNQQSGPDQVGGEPLRGWLWYLRPDPSQTNRRCHYGSELEVLEWRDGNHCSSALKLGNAPNRLLAADLQSGLGGDILKLTSALVGLAALGGVALSAGAASAMPVGVPTETSNIVQAA